jgi:hypothetical protein
MVKDDACPKLVASKIRESSTIVIFLRVLFTKSIVAYDEEIKAGRQIDVSCPSITNSTRRNRETMCPRVVDEIILIFNSSSRIVFM